MQDEISIPDPVLEAFIQMFPQVDQKHVEWECDDDIYEADFTDSHVDIEVSFKADGSFVEKETSLPTSAVPISVLTAIRAQYPNSKIKSVEMVEKSNGELLFEVKIKIEMELHVAPNGTIVASGKDL